MNVEWAFKSFYDLRGFQERILENKIIAVDLPVNVSHFVGVLYQKGTFSTR